MPNIETLSYSFYTMYLKLPGSHSTVLGKKKKKVNLKIQMFSLAFQISENLLE